MLKLQSWKFDIPDRLFYSIEQDWENCFEHDCFKELIPEFYIMNPDFLKNKLNLDLGRRQNSQLVSDVELPKWANNDPVLFLFTMRKALESEYVSSRIHHWIDLIFGYKQNGEEAFKNKNVFHPRSYEGSINLDDIEGNQIIPRPFSEKSIESSNQ
jgi:factor associated with neutral sphingomyelinase activation